MRTTSAARTTTNSIPRDASSLGPAVHPGAILLEEFLRPLEMTQASAAQKLGMSTVRLNEIVRGKRGVTADTALRLAQLFTSVDGSTTSGSFREVEVGLAQIDTRRVLTHEAVCARLARRLAEHDSRR